MRVGTGSHASCCMGWQEKARQCCNKLGFRASCLASAWMQGPYLGHASFDAPTCANHSHLSFSLPFRAFLQPTRLPMQCRTSAACWLHLLACPSMVLVALHCQPILDPVSNPKLFPFKPEFLIGTSGSTVGTVGTNVVGSETKTKCRLATRWRHVAASLLAADPPPARP